MAKYDSKRIKAIVGSDLLTHEGRLEALQEIARVCMEGVVSEVVVQKTGTIEPAIRQDPTTAIAAIRTIASLQDNQDERPTEFIVNILETNP